MSTMNQSVQRMDKLAAAVEVRQARIEDALRDEKERHESRENALADFSDKLMAVVNSRRGEFETFGKYAKGELFDISPEIEHIRIIVSFSGQRIGRFGMEVARTHVLEFGLPPRYFDGTDAQVGFYITEGKTGYDGGYFAGAPQCSFVTEMQLSEVMHRFANQCLKGEPEGYAMLIKKSISNIEQGIDRELTRVAKHIEFG